MLPDFEAQRLAGAHRSASCQQREQHLIAPLRCGKDCGHAFAISGWLVLRVYHWRPCSATQANAALTYFSSGRWTVYPARVFSKRFNISTGSRPTDSAVEASTGRYFDSCGTQRRRNRHYHHGSRARAGQCNTIWYKAVFKGGVSPEPVVVSNQGLLASRIRHCYVIK